ncbi:FecR family protein [Pedobacter heparinus]|uniref:FecR protein n=1 Tax=Pedobacter heparinus (strain ATCC 13125 / DSM 2366 / CIP 104194 / JCM 7457 / NBRC 12017 / NCIMB 9290 / NRRL B-14731 / HIM 762-3) TaxID=485917 RepID=C6Y2V8_PEDHD|nr:FecR family protein [Pedobacter heparinus]ACU03171.1 FecR protein [Pedobacter heparinus DSM 2366]
MNEQKAKELLERYNSGLLSPAEKQQLDLWYLEQARKSKLELTEEELLDSVQHLSSKLPLVQPRTRRLWPRIAAAASIVLVLGSAVYFYNGRNEKAGSAEVLANDVAPGKNGATLTLANGQKILINDALAGNIATQSGVKISKTADGQIVYEITDNGANNSEYNLLSTTRGQQTQVRLPDGTLVFLNAESSLKYPTSFTGSGKRQVSLTGEGYFEVAKDKKHPFIVESSNQKVEVLGTHFNINSYADEPEVKTTLLEGSVNVFNLKGKYSKVLSPGQQAIVKGEDIKVGDADIDQAMSWKNGDFVFVGEDLKAVMRQVARWYDVEIGYQGNINSSGVVSTISRDKKLSQVLKALQINQGIHFKIEGRRVLVMP